MQVWTGDYIITYHHVYLEYIYIYYIIIIKMYIIVSNGWYEMILFVNSGDVRSIKVLDSSGLEASWIWGAVEDDRGWITAWEVEAIST